MLVVFVSTNEGFWMQRMNKKCDLEVLAFPLFQVNWSLCLFPPFRDSCWRNWGLWELWCRFFFFFCLPAAGCLALCCSAVGPSVCCRSPPRWFMETYRSMKVLSLDVALKPPSYLKSVSNISSFRELQPLSLQHTTVGRINPFNSGSMNIYRQKK